MLSIIYADGIAEFQFLDVLRARAEETGADVEAAVKEILAGVKAGGDAALAAYTRKFDGAKEIKRFGKEDFARAYRNADASFKAALRASAKNIRTFHKRQMPKGFEVCKDGCVVGQSVRGLSRVAVYVPGGTAAYPSSVLMNAIPAKIAGVEEVVMISPPSKNGKANKDILAAAYVAGVDELILVGGAQAVAALAYGTESIQKADKIVGPGNIYVATAKRLVFGVCDIDMVAGPSEITIIADKTANPAFLAADMLSQAEHDVLASSILLTDSEAIASATAAELEKQLAALPRAEIAKKALAACGGIIVCKDIADAVGLANAIAPEHLEIMTAAPETLLAEIKNAGSVFLGAWSPEPLGDYYAGANHVLPTGGTARFASPLSVESFVKRTQYIRYTEQALKAAAPAVITIAEREGLTAHAGAVKERLK